MSPVDGAPISVVIVGFGRMGRLHARTLARMAEFRIIAVVDPDPACALFAAEHGLACQPTLGGIDAAAHLAIVAVPSPQHAVVVQALVARGMNCLVEKPVGISLAEVEAMTTAAAIAGVQVFVGYSERFNPAMRSIGEALRNAPATISIRRMSSAALHRQVDTDVMQDLLVHDLDWLSCLLGADPQEAVVGSSRVHDARLEEVSCHLRYADGTRAQLTASRITVSDERTVAVTGADGTHSTFCLNAWRLQTQEDALTAQARALAAALRGEDAAIARLADACRVRRWLMRLGATVAEPSLPA